MQEEIWKEVKGYEGLYWVSNLGRVKSKRKILKPINGEYLHVGLSKNGIQKTLYVHRLVAEAFIENAYNYTHINHIDENKYNNNIDNLEWCTNKYNINYGNTQIKKGKHQTRYKVVQKDENGKVKVELALAKGKKLHDKRQDLAKKDAQRTIERELRGKY